MAIKDKTTLAVVTCYADLPLLERFLHSVYLYWNLSELDKIVIVWNDTPRYQKDFYALVQSINCRGVPMETHISTDLWPQQDQWDWNTQQHLKLLVSDLIDTEWYIIHDSKDFYLENIGLDNFVNKQTNQSLHAVRPIEHDDSWLGIHGHHYQHYKNAYELFELDYSQYGFALRTWHASVCPVHTQTIVNLVNYLRQTFGNLFPWLLLLQRNYKTLFTEYALISAWHHKQGIMLDRYTLPNIDLSSNYGKKVGCNKDLRRKKQDL